MSRGARAALVFAVPALVAALRWCRHGAGRGAIDDPGGEIRAIHIPPEPRRRIAARAGAAGRPLRLGSEFGSLPVLIDFEYDRCTTLCGVVLDQLTAALATLPIKAGRDYRLVAIDIDPSTTTAAARAFAREHGADKPGMVVLTGSAGAIRRVADAAGFPYHRDKAAGQYAHPAGFVIATPKGRVSRYLLGLDWRPIDLRLALSEAAGARVAAPAEQILLFCCCYDRQTGRYDVAVGRLLQVVGTATLLALAALVWFAVRLAR